MLFSFSGKPALKVLFIQKKSSGKYYSALAGFIEPGESLEDAVMREMWEEAGIRVIDIRYHSGQPWVSNTIHLSTKEKNLNKK